MKTKMDKLLGIDIAEEKFKFVFDVGDELGLEIVPLGQGALHRQQLLKRLNVW